MNAPLLRSSGGGAVDPELDLTITRGADGRSRLTQRRVSFPWSLGRGYPGKPNEPVTVIPQMAGAGLLAGDDVAQRIRVGRGAGLHLVSAGAMLTYGTQEGRKCTSRWSIDLAPGAKAVLVSEPYVLFDDAALILRQDVTVAPDAIFIGCEGIVCATPGNRSRWETETTVKGSDGTHLFTDRQRATPDTLALQHDLTGAWTGFGTVVILAPTSTFPLEEMEPDIGRLAAADSGGVSIGTAPMRAAVGTCIRIAAKDGQKLRSAMMDLTSILMRKASGAS